MMIVKWDTWKYEVNFISNILETLFLSVWGLLWLITTSPTNMTKDLGRYDTFRSFSDPVSDIRMFQFFTTTNFTCELYMYCN